MVRARVALLDSFNQFLGYSVERGAFFSRNDTQKVELKRVDGGVVLLVDGHCLVQRGEALQASKDRRFLEDRAIVTISCNLRGQYVLRFQSGGFLCSEKGDCLIVNQPLGVRKESKLFKIIIQSSCALMSSPSIKWPLRVNLQGSKSGMYVGKECNGNAVVMDSPIRCCTEDLVLEMPSRLPTESQTWLGCVWFGDGKRVISKTADGSLELLDQHSCVGGEEFVYKMIGKNRLQIQAVSTDTGPLIGLDSAFNVELSSKSCSIISMYGDVMIPFPYEDQCNSMKAMHISSPSDRPHSGWSLQYHGDNMYSIVDVSTRRNLFIDQRGYLVLSRNQEEESFPNQGALFKILFHSGKHHGQSLLGFRIICAEKIQGKKLAFHCKPDGSISLVEASNPISFGDLFVIADNQIAKNSIYLKDSVFDAHKIREYGMKKSFSQPHSINRNQRYQPSMTPSPSCHQLTAGHLCATEIHLVNKWGVISVGKSEFLMKKIIKKRLCDYFKSHEEANIEVALYDLLPQDAIHSAEYHILRSILEESTLHSSQSPGTSKKSCFEILHGDSNHPVKELEGVIGSLDEEEQEETFVCLACKGESGLLKPLHPEVNPQHHMYLRMMMRLQYGGARTRRIIGNRNDRSESSGIIKKVMLFSALALLGYKKLTSH